MTKRANSLIGIIVVIAIIVILVVVLYGPGGKMLGSKAQDRPDGKGQTVIGKSKYAALDDVCRSNIGQVRMSIQINSDPVDNTHPNTLQETKLGDDFYKCPVGGEPYTYDSKTGTVHCPHKGHETY